MPGISELLEQLNRDAGRPPEDKELYCVLREIEGPTAYIDMFPSDGRVLTGEMNAREFAGLDIDAGDAFYLLPDSIKRLEHQPPSVDEMEALRRKLNDAFEGLDL